jgi:hypothetical protein
MLIIGPPDAWLTFKRAYEAFYFEDANAKFSEDKIQALSAAYSSIVGYWSMMNAGVRRARANFPSTVEALQIPEISSIETKAVWLLQGLSTEGFYERLVSIMAEKADTSLLISDYVFLTYISYQETEVAEDLGKVPFNLLHGMFDSIIEDNFQEWLKT